MPSLEVWGIAEVSKTNSTHTFTSQNPYHGRSVALEPRPSIGAFQAMEMIRVDLRIDATWSTVQGVFQFLLLALIAQPQKSTKPLPKSLRLLAKFLKKTAT